MSIRGDVSKILRMTGWSQEDLARRLHVSFATLNSWANGRSEPRAKAQAAIAALYVEISNQPTQHALVDTPASIRVFFTTPFAGKQRYQLAIDAILQTIRQGNSVTTPEDTARYLESLKKLQGQGLNRDQAHYAFIRQGIASADVVIIEASEQDIQVGHELTLALLFHKPTLVLSQNKDFSEYITHDLLTGAVYTTPQQACQTVQDFLHSATLGRAEASMQTLNLSADVLHSVALTKLRRLAKQEPGQFGEWSRQAETQPTKVAQEIQTLLGGLPQQPAWAVFAPVYNEDSPDYIQGGVATFLDDLLQRNNVPKSSLVVEAACGTGALSRQLAQRGYSNIAMFDSSRPMLAEAFRLSAATPHIRPFEADIRSLQLEKPTQAIVWTDYSSNFALDQSQLTVMLSQLVHNIVPGGLLVFDVRTYTGWQIDFYSRPITTFATERFQRIWLNHQKPEQGIIDFDVFIRTRDADGAWGVWQRESMRERMWRLPEVLKIAASIPGASLKAVYGDDFGVLQDNYIEPNLAYIVLQKNEQ